MRLILATLALVTLGACASPPPADDVLLLGLGINLLLHRIP